MEKVKTKDYPYCYGCGDANPIGLRLNHRLERRRLVTEFLPLEEHQGWPGMVHGGILATLLYEVMENLPFLEGTTTMMKSMDISFRRPATTGDSVVAESWFVEESGRKLNVSATLTSDKGELIAEGSAVLVALSERRKQEMGIER